MAPRLPSEACWSSSLPVAVPRAVGEAWLTAADAGLYQARTLVQQERFRAHLPTSKGHIDGQGM